MDRATSHALVSPGRELDMKALRSTPVNGAGASAAIEMSGIEIDFGDGKTAVRALSQLDLQVAPGEFISVLGPSGCGKSSLIGAVAGFTPISAGEIRVDGRAVQAPGPDRGVVFQHHTLFPWKTVLKNVEFGLKMRGAPPSERREAARDILDTVGLGEFLNHYPWQLSGGMQQRVSLARVLVNRPRVTLMDEPFCALDAQTRLQMQELLLALWHKYHITVMFVTHDVDEAIFLSDRIVVLTERPGRIKAELAVALPRPRTRDLLTSPDFMQLKRRALELLFDERSAAPPSGHRTRTDPLGQRPEAIHAAPILCRPPQA
jgi:NitT/TauT family transport system ATP-binding protein